MEDPLESGIQTRPLIQKTTDLPHIDQYGTWKSFKNWIYPTIQKERRAIYLNGFAKPPNHVNNLVRNQKYNILTFLPLVLYNQFKFFFNLFYLVVSVTQFYPPLKVGYTFTYLGPLAFVLALTLLKEAWDEYSRMKRDKAFNNEKVIQIKPDGKELEKTSGQLRVGEIIKITAGKRIPADLLLLYTSDPNKTVYIRTDQLDGETDWKLREPIKLTQKLFEEGGVAASIPNSYCYCEPPQKGIYEFKGTFYNINEDIYKEPLRLSNTMWADTVLTSGEAYGLVTYTGKESRRSMNSKKPSEKVGKTDLEINFQIKVLFVIMIFLTIIMQAFDHYKKPFWFLSMFKYFILLANIIPISLRVNLDFAKLVYIIRINQDQDIEGTVARNSNIPEELGRIQYLLTDKTGTLTQNLMTFKKLCCEINQFTEENLNDLINTIKQIDEETNGPIENLIQFMDDVAGRKSAARRNKNHIVYDVVIAMLLCNNVTPVIQQDGTRILQASSPDEIALVEFVETLGITIHKRNQKDFEINFFGKRIEHFEILNNFPFTSESKRMGIVLRHTRTKRLIFYLKGADNVIAKKVPLLKEEYLLEVCDEMAREGLRTLAFSQKYLQEDFYAKWLKVYENACTDLNDNVEKEREAIEFLEKNMEFLGCSGVEDKLQENVRETIENLRKAGIKIWMLTGDKIETAKCIALSTGIKDKDQNFFELKNIEYDLDANKKIDDFARDDVSRYVLIVDGISLQTVFKNNVLKEKFIKYACEAPSVICCRCSPTQKADVTLAIKLQTKQITCAVGDGGNDVGMILMANIGLGVEGKEGRQAALASDFSVKQFQNILKLILWHGRLSYLRTSIVSNFVVHRGFIISVIQFVFQLLFYYVAISLFNGNLLLGYSTIYTSLPVFAMIFTQDISKDICLNFPELYVNLPKGRLLNNKTFTIWIWKSVYQGFMIMFLSAYLFKNTFYLELSTLSFTALIFIELCNVAVTIKTCHVVIVISEISTLVVYLISIIWLPNIVEVSTFDWSFVLKVLVITALAWLPPEIFTFVYRKIFPTDVDKIKGQAIRKLKQTKASVISFEKEKAVANTDQQNHADNAVDQESRRQTEQAVSSNKLKMSVPSLVQFSLNIFFLHSKIVMHIHYK